MDTLAIVRTATDSYDVAIDLDNITVHQMLIPFVAGNVLASASISQLLLAIIRPALLEQYGIDGDEIESFRLSHSLI